MFLVHADENDKDDEDAQENEMQLLPVDGKFFHPDLILAFKEIVDGQFEWLRVVRVNGEWMYEDERYRSMMLLVVACAGCERKTIYDCKCYYEMIPCCHEPFPDHLYCTYCGGNDDDDDDDEKYENTHDGCV